MFPHYGDNTPCQNRPSGLGRKDWISSNFSHHNEHLCIHQNKSTRVTPTMPQPLSQTAPGNPPAHTIPQLVDWAASAFADQLFLEEGSTRISFAGFARQARQVAGALMQQGIQPGDRIGVWAPNIVEWVIAAIGAQCAGAVLVTLNTRYKGSEAA